MSKRIATLLLALLMFMVPLSAGAAEEGPIIIGYVGALSGDTALWGQAGLDGMNMAVADINAAGGVLGRELQVIGLDGKGEPMDSVNAFTSLIDNDKAVVVVGTNFSNCNIAMAPIADEKKIPLMATAASNPLVTVDENGNLHPYSFRIGFIDPFQGEVLASYAYNVLGYTKAAIITNVADPYSTGITDYLRDAYEALGGEIVAYEEAASGDQDFRAQLSNIQSANPECLFIPWIYQDVALIARQARDLGIEAQFIGADGWDSQDLPQLAQGAIEGGIFCSRPTWNTEEALAFKARYEEEFGITAEAECLFGYDAVKWIEQVIIQEGAADSESIRNGLENTPSFDGYLGHMAVDPATHNPAREAAMFKIENDAVVWIENYNVQ